MAPKRPNRADGRLPTVGRTLLKALLFPLLCCLIVLLLPLIVLLLATRVLYGLTLQLAIWTCWCTRGARVLLVYSDSPVWHDYIEENVLPKLPRRTITLNWSERRRWRWLSLPVMAFHYFGGSREFNPLVVVFRPFRWARTFRLWKAFKEFKHGNREALAAIEEEMLEYLRR